MAVEKIKILGAVLELPANLALPIWLIHQEIGQNGLNWQFVLAGSSKTAPRILFFSFVLGAEYFSFVKSIAIYAPKKVDIIIHS